jgi:hypothetical protein
MRQKMRIKLSTLLVVSFCCIFIGCSKSGVHEELLTEQQKQAERDAIAEVLNLYNEAAKEKNWSKMANTLAEEVTFFGTDSGEVSKNFSEFKNTMQKQWEEYDTFEYGKIQDLYIELDDYARYANVIFGSPLIYGRKNAKADTVFVIYQRTLNKEPLTKKWQIKSGILSIART